MRRIFLLAPLGLILLACTGQSDTTDISQISFSGKIQTHEVSQGTQSKESETLILQEQNQLTKEQDSDIPLEEVKTSWDTECVQQSEAYFGELLILTPFEIQSIFRKSDTDHCVVSYYLVNESAIHSYVLLDLETKDIIDEVNCFPEYDVENDTMTYCNEEELETLKLEYLYILQENL